MLKNSTRNKIRKISVYILIVILSFVLLTCSSEKIDELIMAISPTIDGETTIYYISKKLESSVVKVSTIARGVSFGGELEYADELTLGRSIHTRTPYTSGSEL